MGVGRTDARVHALNYYCNFKTSSKIPGDKFAHALISNLPDDIVVKYSREVESDFHSRYSATGKSYIYVINNQPYPSAIYRNLQYHVRQKLDLDKMKIASNYFVGTHDFTSFMASGSSIKTTIRTVYSLNLHEEDGMITIDIHGSGFLYNMVRIIAGTLIDVGLGRVKPEAIINIIKAKDRIKASKTAGPHGLYLADVDYD